MTLPFDLPRISQGFALLTPAARELGDRAAAKVAAALGALLGCEVTIAGRALPCVPAPRAGCARLRVELAALPACAAIEVEVAFAAALLDRLAGASGDAVGAARLTALELAVVELSALSALEAAGSIPEVEAALAPRLSRLGSEPSSGLAIDLSIGLGRQTGCVRVILPAAGVKALAGAAAGPLPESRLPISLSIRGGSAPLQPGELASLSPGDVLLVDPPPSGRLSAVAPGGLRFRGAEVQDGLQLEEVQVPEPHDDRLITVEVELTRVEVTLSELARLEPGAILPLPVDRRGMVTLKAGDRTLARGQLVDVEGAVGVRIDSLAGAGR